MGKHGDFRNGALGINWKKDKIFSLGIWYCICAEESEKLNFKERYNKFCTVLNIWFQSKKTFLLREKLQLLKAMQCLYYYM